MVKISTFNNIYYQPPHFKGLEEIVLFPGDNNFQRSKKIPNSSIWIFDPEEHYVPEILGNDIGCGMAVFLIDKINTKDLKNITDRIYTFLTEKNILGRGNHFIDICSSIELFNDYHFEPHNILIIHSDLKYDDSTIPRTIEEAIEKQKKAKIFRENFGNNLLMLLKIKSYNLIGDWIHNSVEIDLKINKIIYRKGVIKTEPEEIHILPAHLGAKILFYTIDKDNLPPYNSMPHATGRVGPISLTKVDLDKIISLRKCVYIPEQISNNSLTKEHPLCYNNFDYISRYLGNYIIPLGETKILSYVGRV